MTYPTLAEIDQLVIEKLDRDIAIQQFYSPATFKILARTLHYARLNKTAREYLLDFAKLAFSETGLSMQDRDQLDSVIELLDRRDNVLYELHRRDLMDENANAMELLKIMRINYWNGEAE